MKRLATILCIAICGLTAELSAQTVLYVDAAVSSPGNGLSWGAAKQTLQDALKIVHDNPTNAYEVRIAGGTYKPDQALDYSLTPGDRGQFFNVRPGVTMRGGYDSSTGDHDPLSFETILSGDIGTPNSTGDDSICVVRSGTNEPGTIAIESLFIERSTPSLMTSRHGLELYVAPGIVELKDVVIRWHEGGGMDLYAGAAGFQGLSVTNNGGEGGGTVAIADAGDVELIGCRVANNEGTAIGGLSIETDGNVQITRCSFVGNSGGRGGGLELAEPKSLLILKSVFHDNTGGGSGTGFGGLRVQGDAVTTVAHIWYSYFSENTSGGFGGGLYCFACPDAYVNNCVFRDNQSDDQGGAIRVLKCGFHIVNSTIVDNSTQESNGGGGVSYDDVGFDSEHLSTISNSILWNNVDPFGASPINGIGSCSSSSSCILILNSDLDVDVDDLSLACCPPIPSTNINADPLFVESSVCDTEFDGYVANLFTLTAGMPGSPCVNTGSNALIIDDLFDLDNDAVIEEPKPYDMHYLCANSSFWLPRIVDGTVDMGAYELGPQCLAADWNEDGTVDVPDIFAFLSAWFANCTISSPPCVAPCYCKSADFDGMNGIGVPDIFAFLSAWFAGCP